MEMLRKISAYLSSCGFYYLATAQGAQPKCRPIGLHAVKEGRLYFCVGDFKNVYRQMQENPQVEICASDGKGFMRVFGKAVFEEGTAQADAFLEVASGLKSIYGGDTGRTLKAFYLEGAIVEFHTMAGLDERYQF